MPHALLAGRHEYFPDDMHTAPSAELQELAAGLVSE